MSEYKTQTTRIIKTKVKDPNAPKWPKSSYMIFCKEKRVEHPNMKIPEFSKLMSVEWKKLTEQEKLPFKYKSVNDRTRYADEMKEYRAPSQEELVKRKKSSKEEKSKQENLPKRPLSSYMYFCKDKRKEVEGANPGFEFKQVNSELGRMWREVFNTQEQRIGWIELAEKDKKRYQEEKKSNVRQEDRQEAPEEELSIQEDLLVDRKRKLYNF